MTEILAGILGVSGAGSLVLVAWLVYKLVGAHEQLGDARVAQSVTEEHLEESQFRLAQIQQQLDAANHAADVEAEALAHVPNPNADLAPGDVAGRVRRLLAGWAADDAARADHAAGPAATVPASAAAKAPRAGAG